CSACLPSSLARQKARRARSVVQTGRRDPPTLADLGLLLARSRLFGLSSFFPRTTKGASCSLGRPDRPARSTDARRPGASARAIALVRPVFLLPAHDKRRVVLARSSRQAGAIHRRSQTWGFCSRDRA